jgi:putative metallohydrolase (TIGR04338 family)
MIPRDSQRSKVYRAEQLAFDGSPLDVPEIKDIEDYITHICSLGRVRDSFPELINRRVIVGDGRSRNRPAADSSGIYMPRHSRRKWIVLHELSHTIVRRKHGVVKAAGHGWQFAETYLLLVRHVMGVEAHDRLKAKFKEHRVRFREPKKRRELTEEQRQALSGRLFEAREKRRIERYHAELTRVAA